MQKGFIGLITILTASAIALLIGSTILLKSITEATISLDEENSGRAWAGVNACVEKALLELSSTTGSVGWNYLGGETVAVGDYSCYILPIDISGGTSSSRLIKASSTVNNFTRKLSVSVATNTPAVEITSWTEVADF